MKKKNLIVTEQVLIEKIFELRGQKVMLDKDLAILYEVKTKVLKQAVRRNSKRFPPDFMFELLPEELESLRSHFVTSNRGGNRYLPMAFTEHGVLMLSSVLKSEKAIEMNIQIVRIFAKMRSLISNRKEVLSKLKTMENTIENHDNKIKVLFEYLKKLMATNDKKVKQADRKRIGFKK